MMEWLKAYAWLTGWLALPLGLLAIYAQNRGRELKDVDWTWATIFVTFGVTLGITFTSSFDPFVREAAKWLAMLSFYAILFNRRRDN